MIQRISPPSACLDPETLGALAEGRLAGAVRDAAIRHLAGCRRCHEIFASTVQILEGEGLLPAVAEPEASAPAARRPVMAWLSAAAAVLVGAALFGHRAAVEQPRIAEASPVPVASPIPVATPTSGPVQAVSLAPEAIAALRLLGGFSSPY